MDKSTLAGYKSINAYVAAKLSKMQSSDMSFASLYELMFSEKENIMYENNDGYRVHTYTYEFCKNQIEHRATTLREKLKDIPIGSWIGIYMENSLSFIEMFWDVLMLGYHPLLMNLRISLDMLEDVISQYHVAAVISDKQAFSVPTILEKEVGEDEKAIDKFAFGDEIFIMSSGTTSHIKICGYTADCFFHQVQDSYYIIQRCKQAKKHYEGRLKLLTFLPFYHIFGLVAVYIWFTFFSRTLVELKDLTSQTLLNTVRKHKVTHIFAVPLFWETIYKQAIKTIQSRGDMVYRKFCKGLQVYDKLQGVPSLQKAFSHKAFREIRDNLFGESICFMITGGSGIPKKVLQFFNAIGYPLSNGYGMSEIGITSVAYDEKSNIVCSGCVGMPMPSTKYKIDVNGELLVKGIARSHSIWENGIRTENDGNWFHTKDLAEEKNGRYWILGRMDDIVISSTGENLNPNILEPQIEEVPDIIRACLISKTENEKKIPVLLIQVSPYLSEETYLKLLDAIHAKLNSIGVGSEIGQIVFVKSNLIEDNDFKTNRMKLTKKIANNQLELYEARKKSEVPMENPIASKVAAIFATALGREQNDVSYTEDFFTEAGGSSLEYVAMIQKLQDEFSVSLVVSENNTLHSIKDIYEYIESKY